MKKTLMKTKVEQHADRIKRLVGKEKVSTKTVESMEVWDRVRQGDLYLRMLPAVPKTAVLVEKPLRQLAPGTSMGSRHCIKIEHMAHTRVYVDARNPLCGPVLDALCPVEIEHPEHGNIVLPAGAYRVTFQRQANPAGDLRRVVD
jgi:hypothetical protein